jgi:CubicO group peptidase (beta-lactamase class C family)
MNHEFGVYIDNYVRQKHYRLINSILLYKEGNLVLERYYNKFNENSRNNIKSIWKSILSICAGICLDRGYIKNLDEPISNYLPEFSGNIHPYHRLITIRHLLTMSSGIYWNGGIHYHCPMLEQLWRSDNCIEHISDIAMADVPGTKFVYKEWDVILLSALIGKAVNSSAYEFCKANLYDPLEITSNQWASLPGKVDYNIDRDYTIEERSDLSARDLSKLGILFLNKGTGILSGNYVKEAISPSPNEKEYGFLWWLFEGGFSCRGYGGQEVNVLPEQNIVYVIQATPTAQSKQYRDIFGICTDYLG